MISRMCVVLLTAAGAVPALAQSQPQRAPATQNQPAARSTQTPAAAPAPPQAAAPAQPEQRQPLLVKTETSYFDNWQVTCQEFVNPARRQCGATLQLLQANQQNNTATIVVQWLLQPAENGLTATIQTPTGVLITPGVDLKAGRITRNLPFSRCDPQRCETAFAMDEAMQKDLAAAETAEVAIRGAQNNPVAFTIPLKGFDRAVQALKR